MKTPILFSLFVLLTALTRCSNNPYEFWELSQFKIDPTALADQEAIKIIYASGSPDYNEELEYYVHLIAISQKTGDTVNILTTANNGLTKNDQNKIYNFFNEDNIASKIMQMDAKSLQNIDNIDDIKESTSKTTTITKVVRDPNFDHIAKNTYPTVIGVIGVLEK
jgi:hypothetical protein